MNTNIKISIVSPVYRAENIVPELVKQIAKNVETITSNYEIILVNDSSPDNSWLAIEKECSKNSKVKGINLSRNFGQHYAITAGLSYAKGDWIVVMDCDLQDRPDEIPNLYNKALEGYDSVFAQRIERKDGFIKKTLSKLFYSLFSYLTDTKQDASVANFGVYNKKVIDSILSMNDKVRFFPTLVQWVGFNKYYLPVKHSDRYEGQSSYNFKSLFKLALNNIIAFSDKPLRLTVKLGFYISIISLLVGLVYLILYFNGNIEVIGFTSLFISIWFLAGVVISILGIIGLYVGKIFDNVKRRPLYITNELINIE